MKKANLHYVARLLAPFAELLDREIHALEDTDPSSEQELRTVIRDRLIPSFLRYTPESRERIRDSFAYFLEVGAPWDSVFEMYQPPFEAPENARRFFELLWEEAFPGQSYASIDPAQFEVDNDVNDHTLTMNRE